MRNKGHRKHGKQALEQGRKKATAEKSPRNTQWAWQKPCPEHVKTPQTFHLLSAKPQQSLMEIKYKAKGNIYFLLTFSTCASVLPLDPKRTMARAAEMLRGEKKMLPVGLVSLNLLSRSSANLLLALHRVSMITAENKKHRWGHWETFVKNQT